MQTKLDMCVKYKKNELVFDRSEINLSNADLINGGPWQTL